MLQNALEMCMYSLQNKIPLKFLKPSDTGIINMLNVITDDLGRFYLTYRYSVEDTIMLYVHKYESDDDDKLSSVIERFLKYIGEEGKISSYTILLMKDVKRNINLTWEALMSNTEKRLQKLTKVKEFFDSIVLEQSARDSIKNSFTEDKVIKSYNIEYKKFDMDILNAKYVFNEMFTNSNLFYIEYINDKEESFIKVHEDADKTQLDIEERDKNSIYLKYMYKRDVIDIVLKLSSKKLEYSYSSQNDQKVINQIILEIFDNFVLTNEKTLFISGSFSIDIKNYKEISFYYFIFMLINLINRDASNIIYVRETSNPRALKKRTKYYFRDFDKLNTIDYCMSFKIDNVLSNLYIIKYRAKNRESKYILDIAYLIKKYMLFYEDNCITEENEYVSDYFTKSFYGQTFEYEEVSYTRIPNKITNLRVRSQAENMFPGSGEYTKNMCECKLQPIIIDKEDVKDWEEYEDFNKTGTKVQHKSILFPPQNSSQGPKRHYVCPTNTYPTLTLKPNTGENNKEFPYLPCCKTSGKDMFYDTYEETRLLGKGPIVSLKQSELQTKSLPLPLQSFFKNLLNEEVEIKPVEESVNNSFVACLLHGTKDYTPPLRKDIDNSDKITKVLDTYKNNYKGNVQKFRSFINRFGVLYNTVKQEAYDFTIDDIDSNLRSDQYIESKRMFRFFEYLFTVNIFVFYVEDDKPVLEKPYYADFHVRNIIEEYPSIYLYRDVTSNRGRYSIISGKRSLYSSKGLQNLLQPYYLASIDNSAVKMRINPYKGIIWQKIFKNYKLKSQKIDDKGKCYCINISLGNKILSVYVPPSAPLNIPISTNIYYGDINLIRRFFGIGEQGSEGFWYKINGFREIFIPSKVEKNKMICKNFIKDKYMNQKNIEYTKYNVNVHNSSLFIELSVWLWRQSQLSLDRWFEQYVVESEYNETFNNVKLQVNYLLPGYNTIEESLKWLSSQNKEFGFLFKNDKLNLYPKLKDNLYLYMKKVDSLTAGLDNFPSSYLTSSLVNISDYTKQKEEMLFSSLQELDDWKESRLHDLELFDSLEYRKTYIFQNEKGLYLIIDSNTINETMLFSVYWLKFKTIIDRNLITTELLNEVMKKYGYILYDTDLKVIKEKKSTTNVDIVRYGTDSYSTFLKLI